MGSSWLIKNSRVHKLMDKLEKEGKVITLTQEESAKIDAGIGEAMRKAKEEYDRKSSNSSYWAQHWRMFDALHNKELNWLQKLTKKLFRI